MYIIVMCGWWIRLMHECVQCTDSENKWNMIRIKNKHFKNWNPENALNRSSSFSFVSDCGPICNQNVLFFVFGWPKRFSSVRFIDKSTKAKTHKKLTKFHQIYSHVVQTNDLNVNRITIALQSLRNGVRRKKENQIVEHLNYNKSLFFQLYSNQCFHINTFCLTPGPGGNWTASRHHKFSHVNTFRILDIGWWDINCIENKKNACARIYSQHIDNQYETNSSLFPDFNLSIRNSHSPI